MLVRTPSTALWSGRRTEPTLDAVQVGLPVRCRTAALGVPDDFPETFDQRVLRLVLVTQPRSQAPARLGDSPRLIDGELFLDREMERQMQERVEAGLLWSEVPLEVAFGMVEQRLVFRVQQDHTDCGRFQAFERQAGAVLCPRSKQEASRLVTGGGEQLSVAC